MKNKSKQIVGYAFLLRVLYLNPNTKEKFVYEDYVEGPTPTQAFNNARIVQSQQLALDITERADIIGKAATVTKGI